MGEKGKDKGAKVKGYLFGIQIRQLSSRHMFGQSHGFVANPDGVLDYLLELVFCVAGAELARVRVHCECHFLWSSAIDLFLFVSLCRDSWKGSRDGERQEGGG